MQSAEARSLRRSSAALCCAEVAANWLAHTLGLYAS